MSHIIIQFAELIDAMFSGDIVPNDFERHRLLLHQAPTQTVRDILNTLKTACPPAGHYTTTLVAACSRVDTRHLLLRDRLYNGGHDLNIF